MDAESTAGTKWLWVGVAPEGDSPAICVQCEDVGAAAQRGIGPPCSLPSFRDGGCHMEEMLHLTLVGALWCR